MMKPKSLVSKSKASDNQPISKGQVKSLIRSLVPKPELKSKDVDSASTGVDTSATLTQLSGISQGTTALTRIGDSVLLDRLEMRYLVTANATDVTNIMRVIIFAWNDVATPTLAAVLQNTGAFGVTSQYTRDYLAEKGLNILYDKSHPVSTYAVPQVMVSKVLRNLPRKCVFQTGSSSAGVGQIYALFVSDSGAAPNPTIQFESRIYYYDD